MFSHGACASCGANELELLFDFGSVPVSGTFLEAPTSAYRERGLAFDYCAHCALLRQRRAQAAEADYSQIGRRTGRQPPPYSEQLVAALKRRTSPESSLIIEVGANDGTFLTALARAGFRRRVAIEPSRPLAQLCEAAGHPVENVHLDDAQARRIREARGAADAIVCRHTLEHVPDPLELLRAIRTLLSDRGVLLLEVPGIAAILERLHGFELWDEHLTGFSADNLARLLTSAGFLLGDTTQLADRGSENIVCWATADEPRASVAPARESHELVMLCRRFGQRWRAYRHHLLELSASWRHPVIAVGASHFQSNFLLFTGLGRIVDGLADDDGMKIGKWVPVPRPVPVFPTGQLRERAKAGTVLLTGFGYAAWMQRLQQELKHQPCLVIDPLAELAGF